MKFPDRGADERDCPLWSDGALFARRIVFEEEGTEWLLGNSVGVPNGDTDIKSRRGYPLLSLLVLIPVTSP